MYRIFLVACVAFSSLPLSANENTPVVMQRVFQPLSKVLPYSFKGQEFADSKNRKQIQIDLDQLAKGADSLQQHFQPQREDLFFLGHALAEDAKEAAKLYRVGEFDQARFVLHHITNSCVSCHSKSTSKDKTDHARLFFSNIKQQKLTGYDLAHYKTVTREFDAALNKYEQAFLADKYYLNSLAFGNYMRVALRVKGDSKRVEGFLTKMAKSVPAGSRLHDHLVIWRNSSKAINGQKLFSKTPSIASARKLMEMGANQQEYYHDATSLVHFVSASAVLHRILEQKLKPAQKAEVYHLLGSIEDRIPNGFWISETEMFLEQSIRIAPSSKWAQKSLAMLEDRYIFEFTGSAGTHIPEDLKRTLRDLRSLVYPSAKAG